MRGAAGPAVLTECGGGPWRPRVSAVCRATPPMSVAVGAVGPAVLMSAAVGPLGPAAGPATPMGPATTSRPTVPVASRRMGGSVMASVMRTAAAQRVARANIASTVEAKR